MHSQVLVSVDWRISHGAVTKKDASGLQGVNHTSLPILGFGTLPIIHDALIFSSSLFPGFKKV